MTLRALTPWVATAIGGVLLALSFGLVFPKSNQNTYLVHGLALADPTLFTRDWYVRESTDYHHAFSLIAAVLFRLSEAPTPFIALDIVLVVAAALAIASLARALLPDEPGVVWLVLAAWAPPACSGRSRCSHVGASSHRESRSRAAAYST